MRLTLLPFVRYLVGRFGTSEAATHARRETLRGRGRGRVPKERSSKHLFWGSRPWLHAVGARCPDAPRAARAVGSPAHRGRSRGCHGDGSERPPSGDGRVFRHWFHRTQQLFLYSGSRPPSRRRGAHAPCVTAPFRPGADERCHSVFKVMGVVPPVATAAAPRNARFATHVRRPGQRVGSAAGQEEKRGFRPTGRDPYRHAAATTRDTISPVRRTTRAATLPFPLTPRTSHRKDLAGDCRTRSVFA